MFRTFDTTIAVVLFECNSHVEDNSLVFAGSSFVITWKMPTGGGATFEQAEEAYSCGAHLTIYPHALIRAAIESALEAAEVRTAKRSA